MRHDVRVDERELDRLAGADCERSDRIAQVLAGLDRDDPGAPDLTTPGVRRRPVRQGHHVGEDRVGGNRLGGGSIAREPGERRREPMHRGEQILRWAVVRAQVQVELVDGLQVGDLEEQRPAVGQDVS